MRRVAAVLVMLVSVWWVSPALSQAQAAPTVGLPGTWSLTGALHTGRSEHAAILLASGKVLVAGGTSGNSTNPLASAELYDPATGQWTPTGSMLVPRTQLTASLLPSGHVLVTGGYSDANRVPLATAELFDPATGRWTATGSMAQGRWRDTATVLPSGNVLVAGGYLSTVSGTVAASAELYDPVAGRWSKTGSMADPREQHTAVLLHSGKVLVSGGCCVNQPQGAGLASAEVYDPGTGRWSSTGTMASPRSRHTLTVLPSGQVLAVGGSAGGNYLSTEAWDPVSGLWHATSNTNDLRYSHTATVLPTGDILISGGESLVQGYVREDPEVELYQLATGTFGRLPDLQVGVSSQTATLLPNGKVLIAGGTGYPVNVPQAQLFTGVPDAVQRKYTALAAGGLLLGAPVTTEHPIAVGREQTFLAGQIDSSAEYGTHEVHGAIQQDYLAEFRTPDLAGSPIVLPTSDETPTRDGIGRFNTFTTAAIYWSPATGAHEVLGPIRDLWRALGAETGFLGYPISDGGVGVGGAFVGGTIYSTLASDPAGAHTNEVHGSIFTHYVALAANYGLLGTPITNETLTPDGVGRFNHFLHGSIYWTPTTGAQEVHGAIRQHWAEIGWERSALGYPTSDEQQLPDGYGRFNTFTGGAMYNVFYAGTHEIHGAIYQRWLSMGGVNGSSALGYPVSDEYSVPGGRRSDFRSGYITWSATDGHLTICQPATPNNSTILVCHS